MDYKSGDVITTFTGVFLFVNDPNGKIVCISLYRDEPGECPRISKNTHDDNVQWLQNYGEDFQKFNISETLHKLWPNIKKDI